jgi:sugar phosphate isomerase/epimerase
MRTAITLCQVPEAAAGPFVFHDPLAQGFTLAKETGFDDVELFLPGPDHVSVDLIKSLAQTHGLGIAAVGTGSGMVKHGLSLTDPSLEKRIAALDFIERMIAFGGQLGAPAILGSMQGKYSGEVSKDQALEWLADALRIAGRWTASARTKLIRGVGVKLEVRVEGVDVVAGARLREDVEGTWTRVVAVTGVSGCRSR